MPAPAPIIEVDPLSPQDKAIRAAVDILSDGGVIALPTDTYYGIGCLFGRERAVERIYAMRGIDGAKRPLTFLLPDMGELARLAKVSATAYRILGRIFPGPYCVELAASEAIPSPFVVGDRRTIGVRVPDSAVCERILWGVGVPMLTATAKARNGRTLTTASAIHQEYSEQLDLVLDAGPLEGPASTVVSLVDDWVTVLREGKGRTDTALLG